MSAIKVEKNLLDQIEIERGLASFRPALSDVKHRVARGARRHERIANRLDCTFAVTCLYGALDA
ncbi:MAG: hypothetical protein WAK34_18305, partial [Rhodoplanes sp.]